MAERSQGARTEEPTARRLAEARRQGQVAVSPELTGALTVVAVGCVVALGAAAAVGQLVMFLRATLSGAARTTSVGVALGAGLRQTLAVLALPLGIAVVVSVAAGLAQTGGLVAPAAVRFDLRRLMSSVQRFDPAVAARLGRGLVGVFVVAGLAGLMMAPLVRALVGLAGASAGRVLAAIGITARALGWRLAGALVVLGAVDLLWRQRRLRLGLRMTRDEVERERRQTEGDPRHKLERRRLHREAIDPDAPGALRAGDFVVSGPRLAVALRYTGGAAAPVIVVRGEHLLAVRLTDQARALGVPIFYDPGLALGLIGRSDGQEIPSALHDAVAGIVKVMLEEKPGAW